MIDKRLCVGGQVEERLGEGMGPERRRKSRKLKGEDGVGINRGRVYDIFKFSLGN